MHVLLVRIHSSEDSRNGTYLHHSGAACDGEHLSGITSPGIADLTKHGWNDRVQSWLCY